MLRRWLLFPVLVSLMALSSATPAANAQELRGGSVTINAADGGLPYNCTWTMGGPQGNVVDSTGLTLEEIEAMSEHGSMVCGRMWTDSRGTFHSEAFWCNL